MLIRCSRTKKIIIGAIAFVLLVVLAGCVYWYRNVTQQDVISYIKIDQSDVRFIERQDRKKSEHTWYSAHYVIGISPEAAQRLHAKKTPFITPCDEKNCAIGEWWDHNTPGSRLISPLKGNIRCAIKNFDEIGEVKRQDTVCIGDDDTIIYDVLVQN